MNRMRMTACTLAAALMLSACERDETAPATQRDTGGMTRMEGMEGMEGGDMRTRMGAHMQMMQAMSGDSMRAMLSTHRQMIANMIAQMNREMRDMNMPADAERDATLDSLRTDLAHMPQMDPAELQALMPGHRRRVIRLVDMHEHMMRGMQM